MCYICEAKGHVGANYKAAQKEITAALRALRLRRDRADWQTPPPASKRLWGMDSLKAYAKGVTP